MKKISLMLMAFGLVATSCTKSEFDYVYGEDPHADFAQQFVQTFGEIAPGHDWGFGSTENRAVMRAAATWNDNHSCDWESKLEITVPTDAIDLTNLPENADKDGKISGAVYIIPEKFEGELNLGYNVKFNNSVVYNLGKVTNITQVNIEGVLTFYNVGTMTWNITSGQRHTVINTGTFTLADDANIGELYNGGHLEITDTDIANTVSVYSDGEGTVNMVNGGDFKAAADIHGTLTSPKNLKIQNSNKQYVCGVKVTGTLDLTQGKLESSNIEATSITFDGDELWLLSGGHVKANTISIPNGGCYIHGAEGSVGLIEVGDIAFKNDNDFERTFSDNIYFKISGTINFDGATNGSVKEKRLYKDAADYVAVNGNLNNRLNAGNVTGSPACGEPWTIGIETLRIIAEDLGGDSDFDYNDVVFDAYIDADGYAHITLQAAGGTLPLYVAGEEVHEKFDVSTTTMVNTNDANGATKPAVSYTSKEKYASVKDIPVVVYEANGTELTLKAEAGQAAEKIAVGTDYQWTDEREPVYKKYDKFKDYVKDASLNHWYK